MIHGMYIQVTLATSADAEAAFVGEVFITLHGEHGSSPELALRQASTTNDAAPAAVQLSARPSAPLLCLSPGSCLTLPVAGHDVGELHRLSVRAVAGSETVATAWKLDTITVTDASSGASVAFPHHALLLPESGHCILYKQDVYSYTVRVHMSGGEVAPAVSGGGFRGDLLLRLATWWQEGQEVRLPAAGCVGGQFTPGGVHDFSVQASAP